MPSRAKAKPVWLKIILTTEWKMNALAPVAAAVEKFEKRYKVPHLYFARYTDAERSTYEVSALVHADKRSIHKFFMATEGILRVKIEHRGTGSLAHAFAYQAVKHLRHAVIATTASAKEDQDQLLDVLHWMCNMSGYSYLAEAALYNHASARICVHFSAQVETITQFFQENQPEIERISKDYTARKQQEQLCACYSANEAAEKGRKSGARLRRALERERRSREQTASGKAASSRDRASGR